MAALTREDRKKAREAREKRDPRPEGKPKTTPEQQAALDALADVGGKLTAEEDVLFEGTKLVLPEGMNLKTARDFLGVKIEEDDRKVNFSKTFPYRPWDGARATMRAIKQAFGMMAQRSTFSIFGEQPPQMMSIPVSADEEEQVPWGKVVIPMLPDMSIYLQSAEDDELGDLFMIVASGPRKFRFHVEGLFRLVENELRNNSMYRGKAFDGQPKPQFMDLDGVREEEVVYSDDVEMQLDANVWSLIKYPERMRELNVPLKRAVLFEGPYGCGKTLAAYLTAQIAVDKGWTFVYCRPGRDDLEEVMATARLYQPSVVFFEDVDTVADPGKGGDVERLLDVFDGVQAKGTEILCVLTTNHVEDIHKGMVRPGRLDAVISIGLLDEVGVEKLCKATMPSAQIDHEGIDWSRVYVSMQGFLPAFVKEAANRSVRYAVTRGAHNLGDPVKLTTEDLCHAADGLRPQFQLMQEGKDRQDRVPLNEALNREVIKAIEGFELVPNDSGNFSLQKPKQSSTRNGADR